MRLLLLCLSAGVALAGSGWPSLPSDFRKDIQDLSKENSGEAFNKNDAKLSDKRKQVDASFGGLYDAKKRKNYPPQKSVVQAIEDEQRARLQYGGTKEGNAGASDTFGSSNINGKQASAVRFGESGAFVKAEKHNGIMRLRETPGSGNNEADFTANGRHKIDMTAERDGKDLDKYRAVHDKATFRVDPVTHTEQLQEGGLFVQNHEKNKDDFWLYDVKNQNGRDVEALLTKESQGAGANANEDFVSQLLNRQHKKYHCKSTKSGNGESICKDENGRTVGKVVAKDNGEVVLYTNSGVPIYRSKYQYNKNNKERYGAVVNNGLLTAGTEKLKYYDCMKEWTGKPGNKDVEIQKPLTFNYNYQENKDGTVTLRYPDCMQIGSKIKLGPGVDAARVSSHWIANILPAGRLRCMDAGTCGRDCHYCNFCDNEHKLDILSNMENSDLCSAKGGSTKEAKITVCPIPEDFNWALCTKFSKSLVGEPENYWNKKGDVDVQMRLMLRPLNEEQAEKEFHKQWSNSITKASLKLQWIADMGLKNVRADPTDMEVKEWFIHKNKKDQPLACLRQVTKYGLGGSQVDSSFLVEAASAAGDIPSVFQQKPCKEWTKLNQEQFNIDHKEAMQGQSSGGILDTLGGLFGGGGR